ncbi:MAG: HAD family phosphatase [Caldilineaceae bacterium]
MTKAIIFDLGRVLVHYNHQATLSAVADRCDVPTAQVVALMNELSTPLGVGALSAEEFYQRLTDELGFREDFPTFIDLYAAGIQRDEDALAYALALQQRSDTTVAIMSNTNAAHVQWLDQHVPELLQFDLVMMSNEVALLKPDAAIFELAMELLSVLPAQCIFIDDSEPNVIAAQALGIQGIVHHDWAVTRPTLEAWLQRVS